MLRVLVISWVLAGLLVAWLRVKRSGRLGFDTARADIAAALMAGTFVWLVWLIRF